MSKHAELIERLRTFGAEGFPVAGAAADALEAQERENEALRKDAEELKFLECDLMYWVERAVDKGNANSDIEEAFERYRAWWRARQENRP